MCDYVRDREKFFGRKIILVSGHNNNFFVHINSEFTEKSSERFSHDLPEIFFFIGGGKKTFFCVYLLALNRTQKYKKWMEKKKKHPSCGGVEEMM